MVKNVTKYIIIALVVGGLVLIFIYGDDVLRTFGVIGTGISGGILGIFTKRDKQSTPGSLLYSATCDGFERLDNGISELGERISKLTDRVTILEDTITRVLEDSQRVADRIAENLNSGEYTILDRNGHIIDSD